MKTNQKNRKPCYSNSTASQMARLLEHFSKSPLLSTIQARHEYGVLHPCGRIMELRKAGYRIDMNWIYEPDANGVHHRVGQYVFQGKEPKNAKSN